MGTGGDLGGGGGHKPLVDLLKVLERDDRACVLILGHGLNRGRSSLHHRDICGGLIKSLSHDCAIDRVIHGQPIETHVGVPGILGVEGVLRGREGGGDENEEAEP